MALQALVTHELAHSVDLVRLTENPLTCPLKTLSSQIIPKYTAAVTWQ